MNRHVQMSSMSIEGAWVTLNTHSFHNSSKFQGFEISTTKWTSIYSKYCPSGLFGRAAFEMEGISGAVAWGWCPVLVYFHSCAFVYLARGSEKNNLA